MTEDKIKNIFSLLDDFESTKAKEIKAGNRVSWPGSFGIYTALTDAEPDPTYPGRVKFQAVRKRKMGVRLRSDLKVSSWPVWGEGGRIQFPITVQDVTFNGGAYLPFDDEMVGKLVALRLGRGSETHLGIFLGEFATNSHANWDEKAEILDFWFGDYNPAIWVPALNRVVFGKESWWSFIETQQALRKITDQNIQNVWYVKLLKEMLDSK